MKKKAILILLLLIILGGGAYVLLSGLTPVYQSDAHLLKQKTERFWECVKFKEFGEAAKFHHPDEQKKAKIPDLIEDLFKLPPERLDIQEVYVKFAEIDTSGILGKVKTQCTVHILNTKQIRHLEVMLYWKKVEGKWYLKLRSTLVRNPEIQGR
jgi:hypothetical protein